MAGNADRQQSVTAGDVLIGGGLAVMQIDIANQMRAHLDPNEIMHDFVYGEKRDRLKKMVAEDHFIHYPLTPAYVASLCAKLKSQDREEVQKTLKVFRKLDAPGAVPDIVLCLQNPYPGIVRDACRTLAILANQDVIPSIEPLLSSPEGDVREDAAAAIKKLKAKPVTPSDQPAVR